MSEILFAVGAANLTAGAAVLVVLAIRRPVRGLCGARAAYGLWCAPLLAVVAVLLPHPARESAVAPIVLSVTQAATQALPYAVTAPASPVPAIALALWLAGVLAAAAVLVWRQRAYLTSLGRLEPLGPDQPGVLRAERSGIGPAVVGALRPRIVTPADFEVRFDADERRLILAHERAHLAAGDAAVNALAAGLQCLGWCNPLIHLAARLMRVDQEFACDAAVIGRFPEARRLYAELLLKTQLVAQPLPIGCHWPARSEHPLKERIAMLKSTPPKAWMRATGLIVAAGLGLGAASVAWAANPAGAATDKAAETTSPADNAVRLAAYLQSPNWSRRPGVEDLVKVYPAAAMRERVQGDVVLHCHVAATGKLVDCGVLRETPEGAGFGAAALKLTDLFEAREQTPDGGPKRGDDIRLPIRFRLANAPAPSGG